MRLLRMTTRRWVLLISALAVEFSLMVQTISHPLAQMAFFGTLFVAVLSPLLLLLFTLAADD